MKMWHLLLIAIGLIAFGIYVSLAVTRPWMIVVFIAGGTVCLCLQILYDQLRDKQKPENERYY
jgi:hypothetical protein